jgi:hypothetical protein
MGQRLRIARPGRSGETTWVGHPTQNLEHEPERGEKNHSLPARYADSGDPAYGKLAQENQVLLTMAG